jgi:hypothetical protein
LHFSRHQRAASSRHTVEISAFYLCFEFRWCREKTPHKPATGASWTVRGEGIESGPDRRRIGPVRAAHQSRVVLPVDRMVSDFYHKHLKVVLSFVGRKRSQSFKLKIEEAMHTSRQTESHRSRVKCN